MELNKFTNNNNGKYIEITSHIDNNIIELIAKADLSKVEWIQFHSMEPSENDLIVISKFFKKFPQIYLRWIEPLWIKHLPDLQKFSFDFTNENIELIKSHKVVGLCFENELTKKDDLTILYCFTETLEELQFSGNIKDIDKIIGKFKKLKKLKLESVKMDNLNFLKGINLEYFYNYGSRIKDLSYLGKINTLKTLYLKANTTLENIDFIENLNNLETIELQYLSKITYFPKTNDFKRMKNIIIYQCNRLTDIEELKRLNDVRISVWGKLIEYRNNGVRNNGA